MKVAVVILNWNGEQMLRDFLPSVVAHSVLPESLGEAVVYVADNGSTDHSLRLLADSFPSVRTIAFSQNYGFADGYNKAFEPIEAEYAILLNSDVEVTPGWLHPLVQYMDAHPQVAACQPKLMAYHQKDAFEYAGAMGGFIDCYGYPYCRGRIFDTVEKDHGQYDADVPLLWATGACLMVRLAVYKEVGGLDGRFFAHMEEIDLCWRLRCRGYEVRSVASSVVYHVGGATLNAGHPRKTFLNFRNNLLMLYKNLPAGKLRSVLFVRALLDYVAAAMFMLKGEWGSAKAVFRARREYRKLKREFRASREENLRKAVTMDVAERTPFSILWKYHVCGCKTFDKL
ncbi:MAG: glycosyltransferase family 2 protein [Bacteroidaceae bacterium]|nr:glycosyltransferase family 2 protein [Bacteroidaceae bacterium]MBR6629526.1 glycosyltransferase family 2 protein [Bacteroidaceae bacterium]